MSSVREVQKQFFSENFKVAVWCDVKKYSSIVFFGVWHYFIAYGIQIFGRINNLDPPPPPLWLMEFFCWFDNIFWRQIFHGDWLLRCWSAILLNLGYSAKQSNSFTYVNLN